MKATLPVAPGWIPGEVESLLRGFGRSFRAAIFDTDGQCVWAAGAWETDEIALAQQCAAAEARATMFGSSGTAYPAPIGADADGRAARQLVVISDDASDGDVAHAVNALAAVIATVARLNDELDSMAAELSDRYEELNLVYATSDEKSGAPDGRAALENLVRHCRDHLDVGVVALVLPRQRLTIESHVSRNPVRELGDFLHAVGSEFLALIVGSGQPVVCNDDMRKAAPLERFGPMKLAAAPVRIGPNGSCGVLLIVNPHDAADFSNSDKNLLTSIAEKVAKVIERSYDPRTGLPSRYELERRLEKLHARARVSGEEHCMLCIDIDELRVINETLGPAAGDAIIESLAAHMERQQRPERLVARLENDDFALLLEGCSLSSGRAVAEALCVSVRNLQFTYDGQPVAITVSIGVASMDRDAESAGAVLHAAALASGAAHENGRDRVHVYQENAATLVQRNEQMRWVGRIHNALRTNRFQLFGQLIQSLNDEAEKHVEVLLRMVDDEGVIQPPGMFLPAAERFFLMPAIDRWVLSNALGLLLAHRSEQIPLCSINLSGQSMSDESFIKFIFAELARSTVPCDRICFEITETAAIKSMEAAKQFILQLKEYGCRFSLDDFGTGLSSFSYLKALPVDFVKIDGSFVRGILEDRVSESMVRAITEVGHAMGLGIIAEYVENAAIKAKLRSIGVDFAQGYAIARPVPLVEHFPRQRSIGAASG